MQRKRIKILVMSMMTLAIVFMIAGCGKSGSLKANQAPTITITSYEGYDDSDLLKPYEDSLFVFQQKIYWHATDPDGVISGFAYRVLDEAGNPIATPGNQFVDMAGDITPKAVLDRYGPGWVMHYMPNANQDIPLDNPEARRSIWTNKKYATINFPAADVNGEPMIKLSKFEVIAIDNRGDITQEAAWRKFQATSARPRCFISTTQGNPGGKEVGSGIRLSFAMEDYDPFIPQRPYKYEFKMLKVDTDTLDIAGTETDWFNTVNSDDPDIETFLLTRHTNPGLTYDIVDGVLQTRTRVQARVYDMAGVISTVSDSTSILFAVKDGFRPKTLLYDQKSYALGDSHYQDYEEDNPADVLPFTIVGGETRLATHFFFDLDDNYSAINSTNMKVFLRWGWSGEYGTVNISGSTNPTDDPFDLKIDTVLDRDTGANYFSEITHFDLRYDDMEFEYAPYANDPSRYKIDPDGKKWLRIPLYSPMGQTVVLTSNKVSNGLHKFEVRCVDLQDEVDPIPAVFNFSLQPPKPLAQREGILIIDDETDTPAMDAGIDSNYSYMLSDYAGSITTIKYADLPKDYRHRRLSPSDLQNYKLVIYHSDRSTEGGNLTYENDSMSLFLNQGGNLVISHTSKLPGILQGFVSLRQKTFLGQLGLMYANDNVQELSNSLIQRAYLQKAVGDNGYPDARVAFGDDNPSINALVNLHNGLSAISMFKNDLGSRPGNSFIYKLGSKPVGYHMSPPTQEEYDLYNNRPIGLRHTNAHSKTWLFGFPLSYLVRDDAKALMNKILSEI
ncbi:MAG: DUF748 domain-containing protein [Candidatus Cloacimonetes bacterium]|nr:DUF748 domain-containing protein [Candidatus Cloacimonadota bacterium]